MAIPLMFLATVHMIKSACDANAASTPTRNRIYSSSDGVFDRFRAFAFLALVPARSLVFFPAETLDPIAVSDRVAGIHHPALKDSPHEVSNQGEYQDHESGNPEQESGS
jgi:hypothetical protein